MALTITLSPEFDSIAGLNWSITIQNVVSHIPTFYIYGF